MKNKILIIFFTFLFGMSVGQNRQPNLKFYNLNHHPKEIIEYSYYFNKKNKIHYDSCIYKFNHIGNIISISYHNLIDSSNLYTEFIYNEKNLLIKKIYKQTNNSYLNAANYESKEEIIYDSSDRIKRIIYSPDSIISKEKSERIYYYNMPSNFDCKYSSYGITYILCDSTNNIIKSAGSTSYYSYFDIYNYYPNGNLKEIVTKANTDSLNYKNYNKNKAKQARQKDSLLEVLCNRKIDYTYDELNNQLSKKNIYHTGNGYMYKYQYEYDSFQNWINKSEQYIDIKATKNRTKKKHFQKNYHFRKIIYYEN